MKEHQALLRVDLRQNADPQLGILKGGGGAAVVCSGTAAGMGGASPWSFREAQFTL